jgi:hypothetical protein
MEEEQLLHNLNMLLGWQSLKRRRLCHVHMCVVVEYMCVGVETKTVFKVSV